MDVDAAVQSQIRTIEATYGKPLDHWFAVIDASGLAKHNQVVAMLKADHGLAHGAAHRVSLLARQRHDAGAAEAADPAGALYTGAKAALRPLHEALLGQIRALGPLDIAPKKGYLSLRRRRLRSTRSSPAVSASPLPLILTTNCAAGSPPRMRSPGSHGISQAQSMYVPCPAAPRVRKWPVVRHWRPCDNS
jgi:Domain of unknown function (DUF4287)